MEAELANIQGRIGGRIGGRYVLEYLPKLRTSHSREPKIGVTETEFHHMA